MKKLLSAFLFLPLSIVFAWEPPFYGNTRPARSLEISQEIAFVSSPGNDPVIVVQKDSSAVVRFAAAELQKYLIRKIGRRIEIVPDVIKGRYPIILGLNSCSEKAGLDAKKLCRDAFYIKITPQATFIAGRDDRKANPAALLKTGDHLAKQHCYERATYFGVLDFLERFAGVRFYFPHEDFIIVPQGELKLPQTMIFDRPDFEQRWHSPYNGFYDDPAKPNSKAGDPLPVKNLNWYRNRMQTAYTPNNHGLHHLAIYKRFAKTHPEYLADTPMRDGNGKTIPSKEHFCYSRGLTQVVAEDALAFFRGQSAASRGLKSWSTTQAQNGTFSVMPSDSMYGCHCPGCQKQLKEGDLGASNMIWNFTCDIADALTKAGVKGWISQDAYAQYVTIPDREIPDNVLVTLCTYGPWSVGDADSLKKDCQKIRSWRKKAGKPLILWNYALKYSGRNIPWIPDSTPRATAQYYKDNAPYTYGMFIESGTDFYIFHYLTYYILGKVAWDNKADTDKILEEHFQLMYGPAAKEMMQFFDRLEYLWLHKINGKVVQTAIGPTQGTVSKKELYEKIYHAGELKNLKKHLDTSEKQCAESPEQLRRIAFVRKNFYGAIEKGLEEYTNFGSARSEFGINVPQLKGEITIDGKTDDAAWENVPAQYLQKAAVVRTNPKFLPETKFRVGRDDRNLYIRFDCVEPEYDKRVTSQPGTKGHDPFFDDGIEVFLVSSPMHIRYYQLVVNSAGATFARRWKIMGGRFYNDPPWPVQWKAAVGRTADGWCAEISVPLKYLEDFDGKMLRANFCRHRHVEQESYAAWSPFLEHKFHEPDNFGQLFMIPREQKNLVKNPDFLGAKKGPRSLTGGGWGITVPDAKAGFIALDKEHFVYGGQSIYFGGLKKGERTGVVQDLNGLLKPDTTYRIGYYIRCENVLPYDQKRMAGAWVSVFLHDKNHQCPLVGFSGTFPWRYFSMTFRTPKILKKCFLSVRLNNASGRAYFDHILIEEVK